MKKLFIENFVELKQSIKSSRNKQFQRLVDHCSKYFFEDIPDNHPSKSTTYMGMAIANLALCYILSEQKHYLNEARRWILKVVNYPKWGNAHLVDVDLSASWILFGLSLAYDWLKNDLSSEERILVRDKLILQSNKMYDYKMSNEGHGWSTNYWQNHNWINLNGLATSGFALQDDYPDAAKFIEVAKSNFEVVFNGLPDDGSDYEGVVYWRYGVIWLFAYAHLLKTQGGKDYFKNIKFLENTFYYRLYQATPNLEESFNFGDCHDRRSSHCVALYYKTASEYNNEYAQYLGNLVIDNFLFREAYESKIKPGILPEAMFELIFYNPSIKSKSFEDLPLTKFFEDLGLLAVRSSWNKDATMLTYKCGYPGGKLQYIQSREIEKRNPGWKVRSLSHQHADDNSFLLFSNNRFLVIDEGYDREVRAEYHNIFTIDDKGYISENVNDVFKNIPDDAYGEIKEFVSEDSYTYIAGDSSKHYDRSLKLTKNTRHLLYTKSNIILIFDELDSDLEHQYSYNMHCDTYPIELSKGIHLYQNGLAKMHLISKSNQDLEYQFKDNNVRSIMTTQEPENYTESRMKTIKIKNKDKNKSFNLLNILIPESIFNNTNYQIKDLTNQSQIGCEITFDSHKLVYLFALDNQDIKIDDILVNGKWLLAEYNDNQLITIGAGQAKKISYQGKAISNLEKSGSKFIKIDENIF